MLKMSEYERGGMVVVVVAGLAGVAVWPAFFFSSWDVTRCFNHLFHSLCKTNHSLLHFFLILTHHNLKHKSHSSASSPTIMASPPRSSPATSPPYPHHTPLPLNNPRKRPSLHLTNTQNAPSKRRKQGSIASGASSAHPLRQTSFPPNEALGDSSAVRSPSVESDFTAITGDGARSAITAGSGRGGKGKRGRRAGKRRTLSGSATAEKSKQGRRGGVQSERSVTADYGGEEDPEDEDDDDGGEGLDDAGEEMDKDAERKNLSVLVDAFGSEQIERYEMFRRVKLKKETVRKVCPHLNTMA